MVKLKKGKKSGLSYSVIYIQHTYVCIMTVYERERSERSGRSGRSGRGYTGTHLPTWHSALRTLSTFRLGINYT